MGTQGSPVKSYDYLLKFLLVGDSDVGKGEILESLQDGAAESPYAYSNGIDYKTTTILLDGRRVKLELWDTSGQGRFCTIFRSYSRGAQGILLVYDITNRWSFDGIDRWIKEIDEHAPGVPRILVGNRLHLAFKRQVPTEQARAYAEKNCMTFFEVSPLCNFNVIESFTELSRIVLMRHGMEKIWRPNRAPSHRLTPLPTPSVQPAGPLLPCHRLLHPCAPHRQAPTASHHQEPPQVFLHGQRHERCHDAWALLLPGQWGWGWQQQRQQPQEVQVHPPSTEPAPELLQEQLQDLLAEPAVLPCTDLKGLRTDAPGRTLGQCCMQGRLSHTGLPRKTGVSSLPELGAGGGAQREHAQWAYRAVGLLVLQDLSKTNPGLLGCLGPGQDGAWLTFLLFILRTFHLFCTFLRGGNSYAATWQACLFVATSARG
ncbi:ras-related protein Rab-40C isoform X1 [Nycticebus coucang]|uniref:ras-related protein Rab-40C isoform X1 n=1 Tax=Nycticebus coucang TaxID=9470 RepID=UPI00234D961F|nr:ras-related protein Rab-40C isoform X1 [Nycticebus coucang]